ncbi:MAG TPA: NUDIX domain-containing protein [Anaerolineales bacterium]|nr:NUDIX domain-containing protein [Anaerolineales bacterium]
MTVDGTPTADALVAAAAPALAGPTDRLWCVGGLITDDAGRIYVQKRAANRPLFPNCWDVAGGHVEPGESLQQALAREVHEETGWRLERVLHLVDAYDWDDSWSTDGRPRREADFIVTVSGDLFNPRIETDKFSTWRWIGPDDLGVLGENRAPGDDFIIQLVARGLAWLNR